MLWKMEHLLQKSKCSIFHNIFKYMYMIFQRRQKALLWSKGLNWIINITYKTVPDPSSKLPFGPNLQLGLTPYSDLALL